MYLSEFSGCCGISIIEGFHGSPKEKRIQQIFDGSMEEHMSTGAGLILITLNEKQQKEGWEELVLKKGFKVLMKSFKNPRHDSKIRIYYKRTPKAKQIDDDDWDF